jgi:hypothetical protein
VGGWSLKGRGVCLALSEARPSNMQWLFQFYAADFMPCSPGAGIMAAVMFHTIPLPLWIVCSRKLEV